MIIQLTEKFAQHLRDNGLKIPDDCRVEIDDDSYTNRWAELRASPQHDKDDDDTLRETVVYSILWKERGTPDGVHDPTEMGAGAMAAQRSTLILDEFRKSNREISPKILAAISDVAQAERESADKLVDVVKEEIAAASAAETAAADKLVAAIEQHRKIVAAGAAHVAKHADAASESFRKQHAAEFDKLFNLAKWSVIGVGVLLLAIALSIFFAPKAHAQDPVQVNRIGGTSTTGIVDSGNQALRVNVVAGGASGGTSSSFGSAFPAAGTAIGVKVGANMTYLTADGSGYLQVNCAVGCSGGASTPADTFSTPTTASLNMTFPMVWNGTTWDRLKGDATNGAYVNIKQAVALAVTGTFWQATQPVSGTFWQATQPVSIASMPSTPITNANLDTPLSTLNTNLAALVSGLTQGTSPWVVSFSAPQHVIIDSSSTIGVTQSTSPWVISFTAPQHVILDSGSVTFTNSSIAATQSGTWNIADLGTIATITPTFGDKNNVASITGGLNTVPVGRYDSTQPTLTSGRFNALQLDSRGSLAIAKGVAGFSIDNSSFAATSSTATSFKAEVVGPTADNAVNPTAKVATLPAVANAAQPSYTEAHVVPLSLDLNGGLRTVAAQTPLSTGTITASNSTVTVNTTGYAAATVTVHGTYSGVNFAFQFSDDAGTTYYPTTCTRSDVSIQENNSGVLAPNTSRAWDCSVYGSTQLQIAASAYTSGTATVGITLIAAPLEAAPTVSIASLTPTNVLPTQFAYGLPVRDPLSQNIASAIQSLTAAQSNYRIKAGSFGSTVGMVGDSLKTYNTNVSDPCSGRKGNVAISQTAVAKLVSGRPGMLIAVCSLSIIAGAAEIPSVIEGTGTTCGTGSSALMGSTTTANGMSLAANGGLTFGNGAGTAATTSVPGDDLCLTQNGSNRLAGNITFAFYAPNQ